MLGIMLHIAYLAAIGLSLYTGGWLLVKADKNRITGALVACQFLIIIWCIPQLFSSLPMTKGMKYLSYAISYMGISFIGPAWLKFAFLYSRRRLNPWAELLLFGISAVDYSALLTNEYHHLFYLVFEVEAVTYGPVFYFHMIYTYACVFLGMAVVLRDFRKNRVAFAQIAVILLSAAVPLGFNLLYMTGVVKSGFDLTPPAFALSSLLMLLAVFRYDLLDVNPLASAQIFSSIAEGVVIYNGRGMITYCNGAAARWFGVQAGERVERLEEMCGVGRPEGADCPGDVERSVGAGCLGGAGRPVDAGCLGDMGRQVGADYPGDAAGRTPPPVLTLPGGEKIEVKRYCHRNRGGQAVAGTFLFTDVGKYFELLEQSRALAVSNQKLAILQERNRIAQEVHDTAGHTLTMISSLLKLIRIAYEEEREPKQAETSVAESFDAGTETGIGTGTGAESGTEVGMIGEYLRQAQELAGGGLRELRSSINHLKQTDSGKPVTDGVYQLAGSVKEFEVEVEIQGEDGPEFSHLSPIVYSCLREAITNCLKYAGATHMDVIVKFMPETLNLYIFDNGGGCADLQEGNGISGIRERVANAGGQARFLSGSGEGFQIVIRLPV